MKTAANSRFSAANVTDLYPQIPCLSECDDSIKRRLIADVRRLRRKDLVERYPREWNCFRAMLQRERTGIASVHESLRRFKHFLEVMGPCPAPGYTVDRIDPLDPEYAEGKIRWASKSEQANNRTTTIMLRHADGRIKSLAEWARITRQKPDTLRKRYERGWAGEEIITGNRASGVAPVLGRGQQHRSGKWPDIVHNEADWEQAWRLLAAQRAYRGLSRDEFFIWIAINARRYRERRLAARFPEQFGEDADPAYMPGPPLTDDPEYKFFMKLGDSAREIERRVRRTAYDHISVLIRKYPHVRKVDQVPDVIVCERAPYIPPW